MKYSKKMIQDALSELNREMRMRQDVYPRLIQTGKLSKELAATRNSRLDYAIMVLTELKHDRPDNQIKLNL